MTDIALTAAQIAAVYPEKAEIFPFITAETITPGQPVFLDSNGKVELADANGSGEQQIRGIALTGGGAGDAISILKKGHVYGYTISGLAYDAIVYLSDTVGALADASGTLAVNVGRVVPMPDASLTKVLYVECDWLRVWA
jgi:hypothetical protein